MKRYLLPERGEDFKVNLHTHTTISDGLLTPEEVKKAYKDAGYAAVAFTDHEVMIPHNDLSDDAFIAINGVECAIKRDGPQFHSGPVMPVYHFCLLARDPENDVTPVWHRQYCHGQGHNEEYADTVKTEGAFHRVYSVTGANALTAEGVRQGFFVTYNHPRWSLQTPADYEDLVGIGGVEVHNTGCVAQGDCNAEPLDVVLRRGGARPFPIAADDMHSPKSLFGGWNVLRAEKLTYENLIAALDRGDGYATQGPEIYDLYVEDGKAVLTCSPAVKVTLRTNGRGAPKVLAVDAPLTRAEFAVPEPYDYIRFEVTDATGKTAWTRAYFKGEEY